MRIEKISQEPDRAGRYLVTPETGKPLRLYPQTVADFCLYAGRELNETQWQELLRHAGEISAKMRAVRIVAASPVSAGDLESRLRRKGETPEDARSAALWMQELNLVDDRETAAQLVHRGLQKGYGINRLKQMLYEKQIPKELWDEALADLPEQDEEILSFLEKRLGNTRDPREEKRAIDALLRRGHTWGDIRRCLARRGTAMELEAEE